MYNYIYLYKRSCFLINSHCNKRSKNTCSEEITDQIIFYQLFKSIHTYTGQSYPTKLTFILLLCPSMFIHQ